jgi:hypothetical protein
LKRLAPPVLNAAATTVRSLTLASSGGYAAQYLGDCTLHRIIGCSLYIYPSLKEYAFYTDGMLSFDWGAPISKRAC